MVELPVATVNVELYVGIPDTGLNEQTADGGQPDCDSATVCGVPLSKVTVAIVEVLLFWPTVPLVGLTETEKSKGGAGGVKAGGN